MKTQIVDGKLEYIAEPLTKREWFAGMALMGMHARDSYDEGLKTPKQRAHICFIDADAMIEASKK